MSLVTVYPPPLPLLRLRFPDSGVTLAELLCLGKLALDSLSKFLLCSVTGVA